MRLYTEYIRQKEKQEEDKKRSFERYQEKIENNRMNVPKVKSWQFNIVEIIDKCQFDAISYKNKFLIDSFLKIHLI